LVLVLLEVDLDLEDVEVVVLPALVFLLLVEM
jgi:hypothetical protein